MNRLKQLRTEANESQEYVGTLIGVSGQAVGQYELGKRGLSQDKIVILANHYSCSTDYLLGRKSKADQVHNATVDEALGTIMSFEGQPVTEHDKKVMKDLVEKLKSSDDNKKMDIDK